MSTLMSETRLETKVIIPALTKLGYKYINDNDLLLMRKSNAEVLIDLELEKFLQRKKYNQNQINDVIRKLRDLKGSDQKTSNKLFLNYLSEGIKIQDPKLKKSITIKLFDKKNINNNSFIVTNQFKMYSTNPNYINQFPDLVIYLNGIPISVIELKTPKNVDDDILEKAYNQINNYQMFLNDLFIYNAFNVVSDGNSAKVGTLTSSFSRYSFWRGKNFAASAMQLFSDLFQKENLLTLISEYTFYTNHKQTTKIMAGYHQYYGVNAIKKSILQAMDPQSGDKKGGVFWHTQGSGKSFSMIFLVNQIAKKKPGTTFIVVTDRNDLDDQLFNNFNSATNYFVQKIKNITSIKELKTELLNRQQDGIFFTTVQKFDETVGTLIERDNILVITDEAHRSHNNINEEFIISNNNEVVSKFGYAANLRKAFPNATFVGFTGTPIENDDKSTSQIFGSIKTKYVLLDAERDNVIVPIKYESRKPQLNFDEKALQELETEDAKFNQYVSNQSMAPSEIIKKKNKFLKKLENFISDKDRILGVSKDFIEHYQTREKIVKGKCMFVAYNRKIAFKYYQTILKLKPEWKDKIKLVIIQGNPQTDPYDLIEVAGNSKYRQQLGIEFKNQDSPLKIIIVVDMWLTGFDVPSLDTLYLDKPLKMHNLMQSIARTNRVYNDNKQGITKECGVVVDYIGIWNKLGEALAFYAGKKLDDAFTNERDLGKLKESYDQFLAKTIFKNFLPKTKNSFDPKIVATTDGLNYLNDKTEEGANEVVEAKRAQDFLASSKQIPKFYKEIASVISAEERLIYQLVILIRQRLIKIALDQIDFSQVKNKMLTKLEDAIKYEKTIVVDAVKGQSIQLSDIIKFFDQKLKENTKYLDVLEKAGALKEVIKAIQKVNLIRASKIGNELKNLMYRYENSYITLEELMDGLIFIKNKSLEVIEGAKKDGFSQQERTFFEILDKPLEQSDYDKKQIKLILKELLVIINNDQKVNKQWIFNATLVKKVRGEIKGLLRKHNYPPTEVKYSVDKIVGQIKITKEYHE